MPRRKRKYAKKVKPAKGKEKRGRKHIFTPEQKRVIDRLIREALKEQLRTLARSL